MLVGVAPLPKTSGLHGGTRSEELALRVYSVRKHDLTEKVSTTKLTPWNDIDPEPPWQMSFSPSAAFAILNAMNSR